MLLTQFPCTSLNQKGFTIPQSDLVFGDCGMFCRNIRHFKCAGYYEEKGNCLLLSIQDTIFLLQEDRHQNNSNTGTVYCDFYIKKDLLQPENKGLYASDNFYYSVYI